MIDRTTLDLRLADHRSTTARIEGSAWQRQQGVPGHPARAVMATVLVALGARLARVAHVAAHAAHRQPGRDAA